MHQKSIAVLVVCFSLLLGSSFAPLLPSSGSSQLQAQSNSPPSWIFTGAYLNYSVDANFGFGLNLGNGSTMALSGNFTGSVRLGVVSISSGEANVSSIPNLSFKMKTTYVNGSASFMDQSFGPANASYSLVPLNETNISGALEEALNGTTGVNSFSSYEPNLNTSLSVDPAQVYQFNSTMKVIALHLHSSVSEATTISPELGSSDSFSINGSSDSYTSMAQDIPLKETLSMNGSAAISGLPGLVQDVSFEQQSQSGGATGNLAVTVTLSSTNVDLSMGQTDQSVVSVPNYSTELDVVSNSTISGATTSGNKLIVNVTGPSGTKGVLDVVVSPSLLNRTGINSISQVGVTLDGQTYDNYTVTSLGGSYVFTIYYHHSSHSIGLTFPNANLGSNTGAVSSLSVGGSSSSSLSSTLLLEIGAVVIIVVVVALVIGFTRRGKGKAMMSQAPTPAPVQITMSL